VSMITQGREAPIQWSRDLNASTATTVFPSLATDGVAIPAYTGRNGPRVHIMLDYTVGSGVMSTQIPVYGYANPSTTLAASTWVYLGSLNGGASITADTSRWSASATRIVLAEVFAVSGENYSRIATRAYAPGGTSPVVSTYVGFPIT
jgi:hypothetical protein